MFKYLLTISLFLLVTSVGFSQNSSRDSIIVAPGYPGGMSALHKFINNNIKYPIEAAENGIQGTVQLEFTIKEDGQVDSITVVKGIGAGCDEEAVRVFTLMPKWNPAQLKSGGTTAIRMKFPVKFTLR